VIFKYFSTEVHARAFIDKGAMLLRSLSYFRAHEDGLVRGDPRDGLLTYEPPDGLVITKQDGTVVDLVGGRFSSSVKHDDIFVYCASNKMSAELANRFASPFCVEINDPDQLISFLMRRAHPTSKLDYLQLVSGRVEYRDRVREPAVDWALPEKLVLMKPEEFVWQDEFRIAIGKRGAFDVENVACVVETGTAATTAVTPMQAKLLLEIGNLAKLTRLHCF
jgi:hypothetical protein